MRLHQEDTASISTFSPAGRRSLSRPTELAAKLANAVLSLPGFSPASVPQAVKAAIVHALLSHEGVEAFAFSTSRGRVVLVAVPGDIWRSGILKSRLLDMKAACKLEGHRVILAPMKAVAMQPRLDNWQMIGLCGANAVVHPDDVLRVQLQLVEDPCSTLIELTERVMAPQPFACLLAMVARRIIRLRSDRLITPFSQPSLVGEFR